MEKNQAKEGEREIRLRTREKSNQKRDPSKGENLRRKDKSFRPRGREETPREEASDERKESAEGEKLNQRLELLWTSSSGGASKLFYHETFSSTLV